MALLHPRMFYPGPLTAHGTASPRATRGKNQPSQSSTAPVSQNNNNGKQGQRRPKGNRAQNGSHQHSAVGVSPSRPPLAGNPTTTDRAGYSGEEAQLSAGSRNAKKHTHSQPSIDRGYAPQASGTDTETSSKNISTTPAKNQGAYAGPTFHASPAPSALPIPKFLSRSVPAKTRMDPPTPPPEDSSDSTGSPSPLAASPSRAPIPVPQRNEDSPLNLLFQADRAERARGANGSPASNNYFIPSYQSRPQPYQHDSFGSQNAPFPIELDGESRGAYLSPPPMASPVAHRSVTDPNKVPQLRDGSQPSSDNAVMQDLLNRLSMSQKKNTAATPPRPDAQVSNSRSGDNTPSPFHDGRSAVRSASGPSTPVPAAQEPSDFFYGNRNLSPLFKAAKVDSSKRNSGLRTEITADSPLVAQGAFQDFSSVSSPPARTMIDPNTFSRGPPGGGGDIPSGPRRGSAPYVQPYRDTPNNRRRTPARQGHQARPDSYPSKNNNVPTTKPGRAGGNGPSASVKKPATSMMSFVPASVAAKQHSSSTPPSAATPPPINTSPATDTLALEQDLKRLLNMKLAEDSTSVR